MPEKDNNNGLLDVQDFFKRQLDAAKKRFSPAPNDDGDSSTEYHKLEGGEKPSKKRTIKPDDDPSKEYVLLDDEPYFKSKNSDESQWKQLKEKPIKDDKVEEEMGSVNQQQSTKRDKQTVRHTEEELMKLITLEKKLLGIKCDSIQQKLLKNIQSELKQQKLLYGKDEYNKIEAKISNENDNDDSDAYSEASTQIDNFDRYDMSTLSSDSEEEEEKVNEKAPKLPKSKQEQEPKKYLGGGGSGD